MQRGLFMPERMGRLLPAVLCLAVSGGALASAGQDSPEDLAARYRAYQAVVREASAAIERGQYAAAIDACTRAIALSPFTASHYFYRGMAQYKLGKQEEAIADFDRALALDSRSRTIRPPWVSTRTTPSPTTILPGSIRPPRMESSATPRKRWSMPRRPRSFPRTRILKSSTRWPGLSSSMGSSRKPKRPSRRL